MFRITRCICLISAIFLAATASIHAEVLTFDTLSGFAPVPNGYGGLNFNGLEVINAGYAGVPAESGSQVAYNGTNDPSFGLTTGAFTLNGFYSVYDQATVTVTGNEADGDSETFIYNNGGGVNDYESINWTGLTSVELDGGGQYFLIDNLDVDIDPPLSATPEPSSFVLLGSGLAAMVGAARRKLRKA